MKQLIWDLPTRIFHWALAVCVLAAYGIAQLVSHHSPWFYAHIFFGIMAGWLVFWRVIWGFTGSRYARWGALYFRPGETIAYFRSIIQGNGRYYAGHNPGSALAIIGMLVLIVGTVASGLLIGITGNEAFEELHEILPNLLLIVIGLHIVGVLLATYMHKEAYTLSMFNGRKSGGEVERISSS
ncbi:MAG: cytochrome b/b6 domain-containing protein, partial [Leptospiraceae bacterium]|nr:cytochrome b/b6 domain-containing protein [Leptospiraceae bacterium]